MGLLQYEFRECTDPGCRFRFPAPANAKLGDKCPRCGAIVQVVIKASFEPENNPDSHPNVGNQVEGINQPAGSTRPAHNARCCLRGKGRRDRVHDLGHATDDSRSCLRGKRRARRVHCLGQRAHNARCRYHRPGRGGCVCRFRYRPHYPRRSLRREAR